MAIPKLRLLVGGTLIEGQQVGLEDLTKTEQSGASGLIAFLGGAKRVIILHHPVIYGSAEQVRPRGSFASVMPHSTVRLCGCPAI